MKRARGALLRMRMGILFSVLLPMLLGVGCSERGGIRRVEWPVMGTVAALQWRPGGDFSPSACQERTRETFREVERLLNAHDPDSEIRRLAALPDAEVLAGCDPRMRPCYAAAFELRKATGGAFNPRWRGAGTLDLGGIAKGFAVDLAYDAVRRPQTEGGGMLVDLGGNLRSVGDEWKVGIMGPDGQGSCRTVLLRPAEAVATSAEYYRGRHIGDGRTGVPVSNDVASVTVVATTAMLADGLSTSLFVLGPEDGRDVVRRYAKDVVAVLWTLRDDRQVEYDPDCRLSSR